MRRRLLPTTAVVVALATSVAPATPSGAADAVATTRNLVIPMSSGGFLRGDLYQSLARAGSRRRLPTVVVYFPYNKDDSSRFERTFLTRAAAAGFAALLVDIRGTGASPGEFGLLSERETRDGYDVVEWAARQPWSNGRVGMWGYSYPGITAALVAALQPPHLRAIVPAAAYSDAYRDILYPGGMRGSQDLVELGALFLTKVPFFRVEDQTPPDEAVANTADAAGHPFGATPVLDAGLHPLYDEWWKERALENKVDRIRVPALFWTGWDDVYPRGETLNYLDAGSADKALVVGPWGHIGSTGGASYEFLLQQSLRWFDAYLRPQKASTGPAVRAGMPAVRLFDVDHTSSQGFDGTWNGEWRSFERWPPPHRDRVFALCGVSATRDAAAPWPVQGSLERACATDGALPVLGVPLEATGGISVLHDTVKSNAANAGNDAKDQRADLAATALVGPVLERPLMITGPLEADLWVTSAGTDAGWVTRVLDIGPDAAHVVAQGWLKASHRHVDPTRPRLWHTHDREDPVVPGEPYRVRVEIWPTSYRIPAGHHLGLIAQAADTMKVAPANGALTNQILVGPSHPSRLLLPERTAAGRHHEPFGRPGWR